MYEIHIKLRNVVTGEEENYRTTYKYKSKGKAARDAIRLRKKLRRNINYQKKNSQHQW